MADEIARGGGRQLLAMNAVGPTLDLIKRTFLFRKQGKKNWRLLRYRNILPRAPLRFLVIASASLLSPPQPPPPGTMGGAHFPGDEELVVVAGDGDLILRDVGKMEHGCEHYRRRCKIMAPCCNELFPCRHCHNEATGSGDRHTICRHDVEKVVCLLCDTEQQVSQMCTSCGVNMGEYFCDVCKFYDDDTVKGQFHCYDCGICRVGGKENYFHCVKCGSCYAIALRDNHQCVENSMRQNCPICYEYLFDSLKGTQVLDCGHTMHMECFSEMVEHHKYTCPICSKTALDMTHHWRLLDQEIEATIMPPVYRYKVWVLCNDCNKVSDVNFHVIGHKCSHCNSYNTRSTSRPVDSSGNSSPSTSDSSENNL